MKRVYKTITYFLITERLLACTGANVARIAHKAYGISQCKCRHI